MDSASVTTLQEVFVSWLAQRLSDRGAKEIEQMLLGTLPEIRNTKTGQDLIAIGREEGHKAGKLVGQIQLFESLCLLEQTSEEELLKMPFEALEARLTELRSIFDSRK